MVGVCFSVSAGLFIGKEGPLIHIGAALGNLVSSLPGLGHFALFRDSPWLYRFRTDRHKRDFVSAGAAAGVAGAFSSPTGGIAFALEEASTFWSNKLTWSTFFATMLCTSTLWVLTAISKGEASFWGLVKFGAFSFESSFVIWEIPLMVLPLGIAGGIIGALFNHLSWCLAQWRQVNVPARNRGRRALEVLAVVFVTATLTYSMPLMAKTCQARVPNYQCDNHQNKYYCGTSSLQDVSNDLDVNPVGQNCDYNCTDASYYVSLQCGEENFNAMATLTFESNDNVIKAMFHDKASIAPGILLLYFIVAFVLAVWTYGMAVPSGLFVPCILMGGAVGRMWGELLKLSLPEAVGGQINPGIYAVIGAAAVLSGVTRITITLTIILFETTNQLCVEMLPLLLRPLARCCAYYYGLAHLASLQVPHHTGHVYGHPREVGRGRLQHLRVRHPHGPQVHAVRRSHPAAGPRRAHCGELHDGAGAHRVRH
jgi:chloride channel 6